MKWHQIYNSTRKISPTSIQESGTREVRDLELNYDERHSIMMFSGLIIGANGRVYNWEIEFTNVDREEGLSDEEILKKMYPKPNLRRHDIKVFCNCEQFRFTFANADSNVNAKTGPAFPPFYRKTNRLSRNPMQRPGACKHIITVVEYLERNGFLL